MILLRLARRLRTNLQRARLQMFLRRQRVVGTFHARGERPLICNLGVLHFGNQCSVWSTSRDSTVFYIAPESAMHVGDHAYINQGALFIADARQTIVLEEHTKIGNNAEFRTSDYHVVAPDRPVKVGGIVLRRNCWIGAGALIMPGVTVGRHSVVAARSVVTRDVPDKVVVAGIPAKQVSIIDCPDDWVRN